jgi:hypothetical protein
LGRAVSKFDVRCSAFDVFPDLAISASTPIYFELMVDVSPGKAPAQLQIMGIPETGNALAGLLALAAAGLEWFRRKQTIGG